VHVEHRVVASAAESLNDVGPRLVETAERAQPSTPARPSPLRDSTSEDRPLEEARSTLSPQDEVTLDQGRVSTPSIRSGRARLAFSEYSEYAGAHGDDPRSVSTSLVSDGIVRIVEAEGPVVAKRVYDIYLRGCGIRRMGHELKSSMTKALVHAMRQGRVASEGEVTERDPLFSVVRVNGSPPIRLRTRGPRSFEEIPPSELNALARCLAERDGLSFGSEEHLRAILEWFDLKRLTTQVGTALRDILDRRFPHVDEFLNGTPG
jgi:hypothetical protein